MATRNFWIDASIDGRQTELSGSPRAKDGGMDVVISQREDGGIKTAVRISCQANGDTLITCVYVGDNRLVFETKR